MLRRSLLVLATLTVALVAACAAPTTGPRPSTDCPPGLTLGGGTCH